MLTRRISWQMDILIHLWVDSEQCNFHYLVSYFSTNHHNVCGLLLSIFVSLNAQHLRPTAPPSTFLYFKSLLPLHGQTLHCVLQPQSRNVPSWHNLSQASTFFWHTKPSTLDTVYVFVCFFQDNWSIHLSACHPIKAFWQLSSSLLLGQRCIS